MVKRLPTSHKKVAGLLQDTGFSSLERYTVSVNAGQRGTAYTPFVPPHPDVVHPTMCFVVQ